MKKDNNLKTLLTHLEKHGKTGTWTELCSQFKVLNKQGYPASERARKAWAKKRKTLAPQQGQLKREWIREGKDGTTTRSYELAYPIDTTSLDDFKEELLDSIRKYKPNYKKVTGYVPTNKEFMAEVSIPDLHLTQLIDKEECGADWNLQQASTVYRQVFDILLSRFVTTPIESFLFPVGNDGLNSEGKRRTTTKGTPQVDSGIWQQNFRAYIMLMVESIDKLRQRAPVDIVVVAGNHSQELDFYIGCFLEAWYKDVDNVNVDNTLPPRKIVEYGNSAIMFTHGDKEKLADLPLIMADEFPKVWGRTKFREVHCGHLHIESVREFRKVKVRRLPSIVPTGDWAQLMGYSHLRCAQVYLWNKERGLEDIIQHNILI